MCGWCGANTEEALVMDFELPEELRLFRESLRRFVNTELIPVERDTLDGEDLKPHYREKFIAGAKALGIWKMEVPEDFGGPGLSLLARSIVTEELARSIAVPARGEASPARPCAASSTRSPARCGRSIS